MRKRLFTNFNRNHVVLGFLLFFSATAFAEDLAFQEELQNHFGDFNGAILVVEPLTGSILASLHAEHFFLEKYSPGSLIKIFTLLAYAADHGDNFPVLNCPASLADDPLGCWDRNGHGRVDAKSAIAFSCNVYFRQLAEKIKPEHFLKTATDFGLISQHTDLPLTCLQDAMVGKTNQWNLYPALLLRAYSAFYNDGHLWRLERGGIVRNANSIFVSRNMLQLIRQGMAMSVRNGTSMQAALIPGQSLVGKTGTSLAVENGKTNWNKTQGWWIGFYPEQHPKVGIMTFAANGRGATHAAPLGGKVLSLYLQRNGKHFQAGLR